MRLRVGRGCRRRVDPRARLEQPLALAARRDPQFAKVLGREAAQHGAVDVVGSDGLGAALQSEDVQAGAEVQSVPSEAAAGRNSAAGEDTQAWPFGS